jgi:hypothetical protein
MMAESDDAIEVVSSLPIRVECDFFGRINDNGSREEL